MAPNPYDTCPCGSGKKFKWCCVAYFDKIERALDLQQQGQHEAAVRQMESVTQEHGNVPMVWGYYAHLLYMEGHAEKAEEVLQKAFDLQSNFPMGHLLRGIFRQNEGEVIGALLLFRKAADSYDPQSHDQLAQVYELIARNELMLNRPIASRAAMERVTHFNPTDAELREQIEAIFGSESRLPECARKKYVLRPTVKPVSTEAADTGRLTAVRSAYEGLTAQVPDDPAGWFNLGLVRAWLGEQPTAVEALQKSVELEWDDTKAEEAAALIEVLRCGQGMENDTDYVEHRAFMPVRDPQALFSVIQTWAQERKIVAPQTDPEGQMFSCMVVEELPSILDTGTAMAKVLANMQVTGGMVRLWHVDAAGVTKTTTDLRDRLQLAIGEPSTGTGPAQYGDIIQEALAYPLRATDITQAEAKLRDRAASFFEDTWAHRSLRSLGGVSPLDAAGSKLLRKRLLGVIKFLDDCLEGAAPRKAQGEASVPIEVYDFNRLRHKLGAEKQAPGEAPVIRVPAGPKPDFGAMSAADLAAVDTGALSAADLEDAMRAAVRLDARELAVKFARDAVGKPADTAKPDRYSFYACLIAGKLSDNDPTAALTYAEEGSKYDAEHNSGKRATEFAVRRAALHAKRGDFDAAAAAFDELIDRNPEEPKFYISATEAMLSAKQGARALAFAEKGLAKARSSGNRDLEGACLELSEAAKRQAK